MLICCCWPSRPSRDKTAEDTSVQVVFLAADSETSQGALLLAVTRISGAPHSVGSLAGCTGPKLLALCAGILFGVFLSEVAAVVLFPASATALALRQLRCALNTLAELNKRTWEHSAKNVHETHAAKPGFLPHGQHSK